MNSRSPASQQVLVCPQCGGTMDEYLIGEDRRAICQYCRTRIDLPEPESERPLETVSTPPSAPIFISGQNSTLATISLVAGILGVLNFFPIAGSLVAILVGREALKKIRQAPELYTGERNARWGIALGWIGLGMTVLFFCWMAGMNLLQVFLGLLSQLRN